MQKFIPRDYQKYAIQKIIKTPNIGLMLDMGMGKTVITLTAINYLLSNSQEINRVLVVAPKRVAETTWQDEVKKWAHLSDLKVVSVTGNSEKRAKTLKELADIYTINRENIPWLVLYMGRKWCFDMVVIDESSSFKNHQSKRFKALKAVRARILRMVELTGTPAPNGLMDLWAQLYLLDGGERLGKTIGRYRMRYFRPGYGSGYVVYNWNPIEGAQSLIQEKISDICISMKSEDYVKLPPLIYNTVTVHLPRKALLSYQKLERDFILSITDTDLVANSAAALSGKLLQLANGACYTEQLDGTKKVVEIHKAKIEALADIAESNEHRSLLIFYWFKHDLERLKNAFPDARTLDTIDDIRDWNAGKIEMLVAHPASAGHGLNLQYGGNIIVWFGLSWSLELYQQANKRLHRSGQKHSVIVHHLVAKGTIDEQVMCALDKKKATQDDILNAIKARIKAIKA